MARNCQVRALSNPHCSSRKSLLILQALSASWFGTSTSFFHGGFHQWGPGHHPASGINSQAHPASMASLHDAGNPWNFPPILGSSSNHRCPKFPLVDEFRRVFFNYPLLQQLTDDADGIPVTGPSIFSIFFPKDIIDPKWKGSYNFRRDWHKPTSFD